MANQTGIAIVIKAFLPTGKTLDEQFNALSIVKEAHATGDYATLLKAATVEDVKTEQKTRRIEDQPQTQGEGESQDTEENGPTGTQNVDGDEVTEIAADEAAARPDPDADVPEFLKKDKKAKAA